MRCQGLVAAILLVLACHKVTADLGKENEDKIKKLETLLKETVKADLTTLFTQHDKTIDQAIDVVMKTLDYVDNNIEELKTHIETTVKAYNDNTIENLKQFENDTATMLEKMDEKLTMNLEHINNKSMTERNDIISWAHQRAHLHEDILKTRITACVHDHGHFGKGVVAYSSADGGYVKESVSIRVYNNTDIKKEDLLNRDTGIFKVPVNAAGEYSFTFSVTIDSFDQRLTPSSYFFAKNGEKIEGTEIFANTGTSRDQDRVPGHRQVALKLVEGDKISVIQTLATDIQDYHVAFCGALLHLDKVCF